MSDSDLRNLVEKELEGYEELGWEEEDGPTIVSEIEHVARLEGEAETLGALSDMRSDLQDRLEGLWKGMKRELLDKMTKDDLKAARLIVLEYVVKNSDQLLSLFQGRLTPQEVAEVLALAVLWMLFRYRRDPLFYTPGS